jgi:branched-chain amino acid transport system permease protein
MRFSVERAKAPRLRFPIFVLPLLLAGCAFGPDAEQESICRRLIPALFETSGGVALQASESGRAGEVFIRFRLGAEARDHSLYCRFAGAGLSQRKRDLAAVATDGRPLGPSSLHYLKDGWLQTQESVAETPPAPSAPPQLQISAGAAYVLQQALSALPRTGVYMLLAAAYALLYGLIGRINLAFGAFAALGGVSATLAIATVDVAGLPTLPLGLAFGAMAAVGLSALYGAVAGRLIAAPLAERPGQHLLVASAGLMIVLQEFLRLAQGANTRWLPPAFNAPVPVARGGGFDVTVTPMAMMTAGAAALAALALLVWLARSRFGRMWRAAADEATAAAIFGVDATRLLVKTFALASALAGLAGLLVALQYGGMGFAGGGMLGLTALVAAILGGIGSVGGAMIGGLMIGALEAGWSAAMPIEHKEAVVFLLLAVLLALKPDGILAGRQPGPMRV